MTTVLNDQIESDAAQGQALRPGSGQSGAEPDCKPMVISTESFHCPRCGIGIEPQCVAANIVDGKSFQPTKRRVRVLCDHCDTAFEANFTVLGGQLAPDGAVKQMTGAALASFRNRIGHLRGDLRTENR